MATRAVCDHCAAALVVPEGWRDPWVECPHCHARVVNSAALQARPAGFAVAGVLGALLFVGGCLVCPLFALPVLKETYPLLSLPRVWIAAAACLTTIVAGALLLGGVEWMERRAAPPSGTLFAVMAAAALTGLAAAVILLVTCLGLS